MPTADLRLLAPAGFLGCVSTQGRESNPLQPDYRSGAQPLSYPLGHWRQKQPSSEPIHGTHVRRSPLIKDQPPCRRWNRLRQPRLNLLLCSSKTPAGVEPAVNCFAGSCHAVWLQRRGQAEGHRFNHRSPPACTDERDLDERGSHTLSNALVAQQRAQLALDPG